MCMRAGACMYEVGACKHVCVCKPTAYTRGLNCEVHGPEPRLDNHREVSWQRNAATETCDVLKAFGVSLIHSVC